MSKIFLNREHAGKLLGKLLFEKFFNVQPTILGIPRGGVLIGHYVAGYFKTSVTPIISKKLSYPGNEEVAFGAISEDLSVHIKPNLEIDSKIVMSIIEQQMDELERRVNLYRSGRPLPDLEGKTIFITDDGIATGATMVPAIKMCKKRNANKIIVAAPVSGPRAASELFDLADEVVVLETPEIFSSVSQSYQDFSEITADQVMFYINKI